MIRYRDNTKKSTKLTIDKYLRYWRNAAVDSNLTIDLYLNSLYLPADLWLINRLLSIEPHIKIENFFGFSVLQITYKSTTSKYNKQQVRKYSDCNTTGKFHLFFWRSILAVDRHQMWRFCLFRLRWLLACNHFRLGLHVNLKSNIMNYQRNIRRH